MMKTLSWRARNKDRDNAYKRTWRADNKTRINREHKAWRSAHREYVLLKAARVRAKRLKVPFTISTDDIVIPELCPVLGFPLVVAEGGAPRFNSPSLDRIVPEKGYVPGNIAVISHKANSMKNNATLQEHRKLVAWLESLTVLADCQK